MTQPFLNPLHGCCCHRQAKLKREEQARQSGRQEIAHSIAEADVLTSELTDLLIEKVYAFPDNRIEIVYKVHDLFE